jgi:hypothetical protein
MDNVLLAQTTTFDPNSGAAGAAGAAGALMICFVYLAIFIVLVAGLWKMFTKAGQPGWAAIVPIYNLVVLLQIVGRPIWWIILLLIPVVNIVVSIILWLDTAKSFGRGIGTALGLIFLTPIFVCILGFGSAQYVGPAAVR